jgi:uncharacterized membrane protein (UPF0127 family)
MPCVLVVEKTGMLAQLLAMTLRSHIIGILCLAASLMGCKKSPPPSPIPPPQVVETNQHPPYLSHPQTNLPVVKLWLGAEELSTEVCLTVEQFATGMMWRSNLAENAAMLFPFNQPHRASFYMKNTYVPLSVAYLDPNGMILEIHDLKPLDENPAEARSENVMFVLEVNQGWFKRHNISTGAVVRTPNGPLRAMFTRRK